MHDLDIFHEHLTMSDEDRAEIAQYIWNQENVELSTIGIDIGSSTSHLLFAKVLLQRQTQGLSSRFVVVHRQVVWRSPIMLTPFLADGTIDAAALGSFIADCYRDAGFERSDVDSGGTPRRSTNCSPRKPGNSSAPPPATSSNARSRPMAPAR